MLKWLAAMTALVDLRLSSDSTYNISASMLSGLQSLTRLQLAVPDRRKADARVSIEPGLLSGKTRLQHLELLHCDAGVAAYERQLLARLGELQQLTYLSMRGSLHHSGAHFSVIPAAAYSALTASSKLQHLDIDCCWPAFAWKHMFAAGRQLPQLRTLYASVFLDSSCLFRCCPGLRKVGLYPDGEVIAEVLLKRERMSRAELKALLPGLVC